MSLSKNSLFKAKIANIKYNPNSYEQVISIIVGIMLNRLGDDVYEKKLKIKEC